MHTGQGFLLTFSVTDRTGFNDIATFRKQILRVKDTDYFPTGMIMIGINADNSESERTATTAEAMELAKGYGIKYIEATVPKNVDKAFRDCQGYAGEQKKKKRVHAHALEPCISQSSYHELAMFW